MIFEIATLLQDVLDLAAQSTETPALDQERALQIAAADQQNRDRAASKTEQAVSDTAAQVEVSDMDETHALAIMIEQTRSRAGKRKAKWLDKIDGDHAESGYLRFDRTMVTKDSKGFMDEFDTIHNPISYRGGPVTKVIKVYTKSQQHEVEPHLVLKEARFQTGGRSKLVKSLMLDLEERLVS